MLLRCALLGPVDSYDPQFQLVWQLGSRNGILAICPVCTGLSELVLFDPKKIKQHSIHPQLPSCIFVDPVVTYMTFAHPLKNIFLFAFAFCPSNVTWWLLTLEMCRLRNPDSVSSSLAQTFQQPKNMSRSPLTLWNTGFWTITLPYSSSCLHREKAF